jgi:hypothetical protein
MRDPNLMEPGDLDYYSLNGTREFPRDSLPGLQKSLRKAHENLTKQVDVNRKLNAQIGVLLASKRSERLWRRILTAAVIACWGVILALGNAVLSLK